MPEPAAASRRGIAVPTPTRLTRPRGIVREAAMLSVSTELPEGRLTTAQLAADLGITEDWIISRTGIRERRRAAREDRLSDFAARAGAKALAAAGLEAIDVDLVLVATMTPDEVSPNTAPLVADALGARHAGAIDVGSACSGFLSGLALGAAQIESGRADRVLLVGADFLTRLTDYSDKRSAPLFGDAAGAVVLGAAEPGHGTIGPIRLGADGSRGDLIFVDHEERLLRLEGPEVFRHAVSRMREVTLAAVAEAGLTLADIDLFVYHQANARITRALGERLGLAPERVVDCIEMLGNASAATIPVGLAYAAVDGRLRPGARVLVSAFGGGLTWGGGVIEWGGAHDG